MKPNFFKTLIVMSLFCVSLRSNAQSGSKDPALVSGLESEAFNVVPPEGSTLCFKRRFDEDHLLKHPRQYLVYLEIKVTNNVDTGLDFKIGAEARDINTGKLFEWDSHWTNKGICEVSDANETTIACKTGAGSKLFLSRRDTHVIMGVPDTGSLALYDKKYQRRLAFSGEDEDNRNFWLQPTDCKTLLYLTQNQ